MFVGIQLLRLHLGGMRVGGGGGGWVNVCDKGGGRIMSMRMFMHRLIQYLVHKQLAIVTGFSVSFIKISALLCLLTFT